VQAPAGEVAAGHFRGISGGGGQAFHGGQLGGLVGGDHAGGPVPTPILDRGEDGGPGQGDEEPEALIAVVLAPQDGDGVDAGHAEAGDHEGGEDHVGGLGPRCRVEHGRPRVDVGDMA